MSERTWLYTSVLISWWLLAAGRSSFCAEALRAPTIEDSIGMNLVSDSEYMEMKLDEEVAKFSPDAKHFVVMTRHGNLKENTNQYTLLLYETKDALKTPAPQKLISLLSSTNNPAINRVKWLDNATILFVGGRRKQMLQVYSVNVRTRKIRQLTHSPTDVLYFDTSPDLQTILYVARPTVRELSRVTSNGIVVSGQLLSSLLTLRTPDGTAGDNGYIEPYQVFLITNGHLRHIQMNAKEFPRPELGVFVSPDGAHVIVGTDMASADVPESWRAYRLLAGVEPILWVSKFYVIDTATTVVRPLINAPAATKGLTPAVAWVDRGNSAVVMGTFLPFNGIGQDNHRTDRDSTIVLAEINISNGDYHIIASQHNFNFQYPGYELVQWDPTRKLLTILPPSTAIDAARAPLTYRRVLNRWDTIDSESAKRNVIEIKQEEGMNTFPRLVVRDPATGRQAILLELNPQLKNLRFARVQEITWTSEGQRFTGGLFLPPDYEPGRRYPLIIQTHGWDPTKFAIDGLQSTAGYAAQALAGQGFAVAQIGESYRDLGTPREGSASSAAFEGLIDYLDQLGIIQRNNVGLLGWSRTGYHVRYALAFSKYHFSAAVIADGMVAGYGQFLDWASLGDWAVDLYSTLNGGDPLKGNLESWAKNSPSYNLERVETPLRLLAFSSFTILDEWEWFSGLKHLRKPVELVFLPHALHCPVMPSQRQTVQQGTVDWFRFWMKGEEDPDPAKTSQYIRWRQLRSLQRDRAQISNKSSGHYVAGRR